jgi:hypothetical protein
MLRWERRSERDKVAVETSSMVIEPERRSKSRKRVSRRDDFPLRYACQNTLISHAGLQTHLPVRPHIATF